jgi:hypothetical protein
VHAEGFDHLAKSWSAVGSRRWMLGALLGGVFGPRRIGAADAHDTKTGHHCTPSDHHPCENGECRQVNDEWTCQDTCVVGGQPCVMHSDCCAPWCCEIPAGATFGFCDNDCGSD